MKETKPPRCPHCGCEKTIPIVYGSADTDPALVEAGRMVLRRGNPSDNDPKWHCPKCHLEWGHPRGLSGASPPNEELA